MDNMGELIGCRIDELGMCKDCSSVKVELKPTKSIYKSKDGYVATYEMKILCGYGNQDLTGSKVEDCGLYMEMKI